MFYTSLNAYESRLRGSRIEDGKEWKLVYIIVLARITLLTFESEIVSREQLVKKFDCAETRRSRNQITARPPPFSTPLNS